MSFLGSIFVVISKMFAVNAKDYCKSKNLSKMGPFKLQIQDVNVNADSEFFLKWLDVNSKCKS